VLDYKEDPGQKVPNLLKSYEALGELTDALETGAGTISNEQVR
jgi:hypothetical protein